MQPTMKTINKADASGRLKSSPPFGCGLSSRSPTVAPSGLVGMKAAQNRKTREMFVQK